MKYTKWKRAIEKSLGWDLDAARKNHISKFELSRTAIVYQIHSKLENS